MVADGVMIHTPTVFFILVLLLSFFFDPPLFHPKLFVGVPLNKSVIECHISSIISPSKWSMQQKWGDVKRRRQCS